MMIGTGISAISKPLLINTVSKVSEKWYNEAGRAKATTIAALGVPAALFINSFAPLIFLDENEPDYTP